MKLKKILPVVLLLTSKLALAQSYSSTSFFDDSIVTSIATGKSESLSNISSTVYVFTREQIESSSAERVIDILRNVPGVFVSQSSLTRLYDSISIRGTRTSSNPQVLFLENGFELKEPYTGAKAFNYNPSLNNIERIEVLIGPASVTYGANAYSGVINIITRKNANEVGSRVSSFGDHSEWLSLSKKLADGNISGMFQIEDTNGDKSRKIAFDTQTLLDQALGTSVSNAPGSVQSGEYKKDAQIIFENHNLDIRLQYNEIQSELGIGNNSALPDNSWENVVNKNVSVKYLISPSFDTDLRFRFKAERLERVSYLQLFPTGSVLPLNSLGNFTSNFNNAVSLVKFEDGYIGSPGNSIWNVYNDFQYSLSKDKYDFIAQTGFIFQRMESRESKNFGPGISDLNTLIANDRNVITIDDMVDITDTAFIYLPKKLIRNTWFGSGIINYKFNDEVRVSAGFRGDYYSDLNLLKFSPRLSVSYQPDTKTDINASLSRAHRAPSFQELYLINNPILIGNSELNPENIETLEISVQHKYSEDMSFGINTYANFESGLVKNVSADELEFLIAKNVDKQEIYGMELLFEKRFEDTNLNLNYSIIESDSASISSSTLNYPSQILNGILSSSVTDNLQAQLEVNWSKDIEYSSEVPESCDCNAEILLININSKYQITRSSDVKFTIRNLLDNENYQKIEYPVEFAPMQKREFEVTFNYEF